MGLIAFLKKKFKKEDNKENNLQVKYDEGLSKSRAAFADRLAALSKKYKKAESPYFEELEEILIEADVGVDLALRLVEKIIEKSKEENLSSIDELNEELIDLMFVSYLEKGSITNDLDFKETPVVLLMEGVNGVGKTTSIAKLAYRYQQLGKKVLLVAGDTFRAGATEQLAIWAQRLNVPLVVGKPGQDPASVAYDGVKKAKELSCDLVIVDTAGRLQNKANLMAELGKITRVISKEISNAPQETFLVIDATTGQNGVEQAKKFSEANKVTGIVLTKMDGTSKGGIVLSIRENIGVPVRFIGLGEKMTDLEEFDLERYLHGLLVGANDE